MQIPDHIVDRIAGLIGLLLVAVFVLGLAWGISSGFAGFWGGLPFWVISLTVLGLCLFDFWESGERTKQR